MPEPKKRQTTQSPKKTTSIMNGKKETARPKHQDQMVVIFTPEQWKIVEKAILRFEDGAGEGLTPNEAISRVCGDWFDKCIQDAREFLTPRAIEDYDYDDDIPF